MDALPDAGGSRAGSDARDPAALAVLIKQWGEELGFQQVGIAGCELGEAETRLLDWLSKGYHGEMDYMHRHGTKRSRPADLVPGTLRVIAARLESDGHVTRRGTRYGSEAVARMLNLGASA